MMRSRVCLNMCAGRPALHIACSPPIQHIPAFASSSSTQFVRSIQCGSGLAIVPSRFVKETQSRGSGLVRTLRLIGFCRISDAVTKGCCRLGEHGYDDVAPLARPGKRCLQRVLVANAGQTPVLPESLVRPVFLVICVLRHCRPSFNSS